MCRLGSVAKDVPPERTAGTIGEVPPVNGGIGILPSKPERNAERPRFPAPAAGLQPAPGVPDTLQKGARRLENLAKPDSEGGGQDVR